MEFSATSDGYSAAFGRLRVETWHWEHYYPIAESAAFGRLRVETRHFCTASRLINQPPSGGCVLKRAGNRLRNHA